MGAIREQKLSNNNTALEITYGGKDSPFGGVDTSAPPPYIDPRCFTAADGFLVVDNKLVAANFQPADVPTLWASVAGVILIGYGTFYQTGYGQLNYALGYIGTPFGGGADPTGVNYTFYITTWKVGLIGPVVLSDTELEVTLFDSYTPPAAASITLPCIPSNSNNNTSLVGGAVVNILNTHTQYGQDGWILSSADLTVTGGIGYGALDFAYIAQSPTRYGAVIRILTVGGSGDILTWAFVEGAYNYTIGPGYLILATASHLKLTINGPAGGPATYTAQSSTIAQTLAAQVTAMIAAMAGDLNVQASASPDGTSLVLTAISAGAAGNAIVVQDTSTSGTAAPPTFYFPCTAVTALTGGVDIAEVSTPRTLTQASIVSEGGTLFIGGMGLPLILSYTEPAVFDISTMYSGVGVLRKFAGSLIGVRVTPQLGSVLQATDMIFAWSSANDLNEWNPVTSMGFVTGAGFEQLADIGDYLSGLIVSAGTAYIIRSKGVSYATATGNASLPFAVNHIGLGDEGEGAQISSLVCQYDNTGAFIGNSNIFQISGSISPIGDKIKAALFSALNSVTSVGTSNVLSSAACGIYEGSDVFPIVAFGVKQQIDTTHFFIPMYVYNAANGTWMQFSYRESTLGPTAIKTSLLGVLADTNSTATNQIFDQTQLTFAKQELETGVPQVPSFFSLEEGISNTDSMSGNAQEISFPQEECLFGRDVTIDSLYISLWAEVSEDTTINFLINGVQYASQILTAARFNTLGGNPIELQIFSANTGSGAFTTHSPQLSIQIPALGDSGTALIRFSKIMMMASFDPTQRPT